MLSNKQSGFTLIEILLVVTLLATLAGIVILAINPPRQLAEARNAQRVADVYAILNAVHQYKADHDGQLPEEITTEDRMICKTAAAELNDCGQLLNLSVLTENEKYLIALPTDPAYTNFQQASGYVIYKNDNGVVTVQAIASELLDQDISASR